MTLTLPSPEGRGWEALNYPPREGNIMVKVLIVDDDSDIRDLLRMDFEVVGFDVATANNGLEGLKVAQTQGPFDLILLDVMMPKLDGFDVCKRLRATPEAAHTPIILLTAKGQLEDKVRGFTAGADDYLVKPFEFQELMVRMRALFRRTGLNTKPKNQPETGQGGKASPTERLAEGDLRLLPTSLEAVVAGKLIKLTPTEFEILYCLMQHVNEAVSLPIILKEVWGYDADEDVRMVRVHVGGLRNKLEPDPKHPVYLTTVTNVGYRLFATPQVSVPPAV